MDYKINPIRLTIALVLFAALILIGLITLNRPELEYTESASEALSKMASGNDEFCLTDARELLEKPGESFAFIDLRNPYEFMKGHIEGALNIGPLGLLEKNNIRKFNDFRDDSVTMILYGEDQASVNGAVQVLRQVGYTKVYALRGGYDFFINEGDSIRPDSIPDHLAEAKWYNYNAVQSERLVFESLGTAGPSKGPSSAGATPAATKPKPRPKPILAVPAASAEPEGC